VKFQFCRNYPILAVSHQHFDYFQRNFLCRPCFNFAGFFFIFFSRHALSNLPSRANSSSQFGANKRGREKRIAAQIHLCAGVNLISASIISLSLSRHFWAYQLQSARSGCRCCCFERWFFNQRIHLLERRERDRERAKRERAVFLIRKRHPPPADGVHSIFSRHASVSGESESACFLN
jgi:hypothetical protein